MAICAYIPIGICVLGILIMLTANIDKIYPQVVRDLAIRHAKEN
jgi:GPH family glycoside/pentoside/hexuronide:cation symporter